MSGSMNAKVRAADREAWNKWGSCTRQFHIQSSSGLDTTHDSCRIYGFHYVGSVIEEYVPGVKPSSLRSLNPQLPRGGG